MHAVFITPNIHNQSSVKNCWVTNYMWYCLPSSASVFQLQLKFLTPPTKTSLFHSFSFSLPLHKHVHITLLLSHGVAMLPNFRTGILSLVCSIVGIKFALFQWVLIFIVKLHFASSSLESVQSGSLFGKYTIEFVV